MGGVSRSLKIEVNVHAAHVVSPLSQVEILTPDLLPADLQRLVISHLGREEDQLCQSQAWLC
jgi:hypothetical protein